MELTDSEWLRELAKQLETAGRVNRGSLQVVEMSDELALQIADRMRAIAQRIESTDENS